VAFRVTDADVARACTIGNRAVARRGFSRLSPRRKNKEPLSRRVRFALLLEKFNLNFSSLSFVIRDNLLHPQPFLFLYILLLLLSL